jgi:hypothetical protein
MSGDGTFGRGRVARFKVTGKLDGAGGMRKGTVIIEREAGLMHVRPLRRRRVYTMPLWMVADYVCQRILIAEINERRAAKRRKGGKAR